MFTEPHGARKGSGGDPVGDSFVGEPLSKARGRVCLVAPVPGALCVECVCDFSGGGVSAHVTVSVRVDSGVGVARVIMEDASVLYGGWCGEEEGGVRHLGGSDGSERVVSTHEEDAKANS